MMSRNERENRKNQQRTEFGFKVFVGGVSPKSSEEELGILMSQFGKVLSVVIVRLPDGESKGFGFVTFQTQEEATASLGTLQFGNRQIEVKPSIKNNSDHQYKNGNRNYKENIHHGKYKEANHESVVSPKNQSTRTPTKLSKHSKNFDTQQATAHHKDLRFIKEEDQIVVEIIDIESINQQFKKQSQNSEESLNSEDSAYPAAAKPMKDSDKVGGAISKFSKEFHPTYSIQKQLSFEQYSIVPRVQTIGPTDFHQHARIAFHVNPYQLFPSEGRCAVDYLRNNGPDLFGNSQSRSDLRINFFTFPGRE